MALANSLRTLDGFGLVGVAGCAEFLVMNCQAVLLCDERLTVLHEECS